MRQDDEGKKRLACSGANEYNFSLGVDNQQERAQDLERLTFLARENSFHPMNAVWPGNHLTSGLAPSIGRNILTRHTSRAEIHGPGQTWLFLDD